MCFCLETAVCPECGEPPEGTVELLTGLAELMDLGNGRFDYGGYTQVDWNGQRTLRRRGKVRLQCPNLHRWWSVRRKASTPSRRKSP